LRHGSTTQPVALKERVKESVATSRYMASTTHSI
jgi:hypothetical protein